MKRSPLLYLTLLFLPAFGSCSSTLYHHQQLLAACNTREEVSRRIGIPDEKIYTKTTEEWVYNLDSNRKDNAAGKPPLPVIDSLGNGEAVNYDKNLKFTFDLRGNVINCQSNVADPVKAIIKRDEHITVPGVVGATLVLTLLIYIDAKTKSEISF